MTELSDSRPEDSPVSAPRSSDEGLLESVFRVGLFADVPDVSLRRSSLEPLDEVASSDPLPGDGPESA